MRRLFAIALVGGFVAGWAVACGGTDDPFTDAGHDATADASSGVDVLFLPDTGFAKDGGGPTNDGAPNPDLDCQSADAGCVSCCFDKHVDGSASYFDTLVTCACTTGATCHSVSACYGSLCKGNAPTPSCDTCLANPDAGGCYDQADQACGADPDCVAFFDCAYNVCAPPPDDAGSAAD